MIIGEHKNSNDYDIYHNSLLINKNISIPIDIVSNNITEIYFKNIYGCLNYTNSIDNLKNKENIKIIRINVHFNNSLDNLPINLEELIIRNVYNDSKYKNNIFNKPLNNLPKTLKKLSISGNFSQPLDLLPEGLIMLKIPENYNLKLDDLPISLKYLELGIRYMHPDTLIPGGLDTLILCSHQKDLFDKIHWYKMIFVDISKPVDAINPATGFYIQKN